MIKKSAVKVHVLPQTGFVKSMYQHYIIQHSEFIVPITVHHNTQVKKKVK